MSVLPDVDAAAAVADLLRGRRWVALTGAGMSTDSGIPDYRGPTSVRATPMQFQEFVGSEEARRRYWARSYLGFRRIGEAAPNAGHLALVELEDAGLQGVLTQNVDGLHAAAGSREVIDLHGRIADVVCLDCGHVSSRPELQQRLAALNPHLDEPPVLERAGPSTGGRRPQAPPVHAEMRPDGDAVVEDWSGFVLAGCAGCGGRLKPDVVFFGESVPRPRVEQAYALVDRAEVLVVLGSSLTVMSGLRFVRHQTKAGRPTVVVNRGTTRGDDLATLKLERGCSETLTGLVSRLCWR
ncbi:NAD-dependent protein deacetylase, SIR2 family [Friedmanniella luteola]|uniref:protein acetyllysine N-acetyltransferase n=1 Tax=Friedmanniella luteola TaxID=546871 RepID=A0A1H1YMQ9_9ACTN|nr:Sir2 family NAD-dependent protein deacetylase [Friedmanniella luteola]SDT22569.1 NAD-dependent protein deacetylase, SIR2 family [Friedmanniella luteola]